MKEFSLKLNGHQRPVVNLYGMETIIDTGAVVPMVALSEDIVKLAWDAELVKTNVEIGGISGKVKGKIYTLHNFTVGELIFDDLDVFISNNPSIQYSFLLSASMFYGTNYSFDMINKDNQIFTVEMPDDFNLHRKFKLVDVKGSLYAQINGVLIQDKNVELYTIDNYIQESSEVINTNYIRRNRSR